MKKLLLVFIILGGLNSCGKFKNREVDGTKDNRIVSLSKQLTEFIFALGKGYNIIGVDWSSTYPDSAKLITTVGYHRALNPEGIISLQPDLVIHSNDIGPATVLPQITQAGLMTKAFGSANTIDSAQLLLKELGAFFGVPAKADSLCKLMDDGIVKANLILKETKIKEKETDKDFIIKYNCKIFRNIEDANKKKIELEYENNNNIYNKEYFLTETYGPLFNRKIQVQKQYDKIKKEN